MRSSSEKTVMKARCRTAHKSVRLAGRGGLFAISETCKHGNGRPTSTRDQHDRRSEPESDRGAEIVAGMYSRKILEVPAGAGEESVIGGAIELRAREREREPERRRRPIECH